MKKMDLENKEEKLRWLKTSMEVEGWRSHTTWRRRNPRYVIIGVTT